MLQIPDRKTGKGCELAVQFTKGKQTPEQMFIPSSCQRNASKTMRNPVEAFRGKEITLFANFYF